MKKSRFSDSQILATLKQHEAGVPVAELSREHNVSTALIYQWRSKFGGMDASMMKRLKKLEAENNNERPNTAIGGIPPTQLLKAA